MKNFHSKKTSNEINFGWLIQQMSINQKSGWAADVSKGLYCYVLGQTDNCTQDGGSTKELY